MPKRRAPDSPEQLTEDQKKWLAWPIRRYCVDPPFASEQEAREAFEANEDELRAKNGGSIPSKDAPGGKNWRTVWRHVGPEDGD